MPIIFVKQFQHRKPGYMSPVTALYFPFTPKLWMAAVSAIIVNLCFSIIYAVVYPEPELSVYNLIMLTFASIFEEAHLSSSSLKSNTIRFYRMIECN